MVINYLLRSFTAVEKGMSPKKEIYSCRNGECVICIVFAKPIGNCNSFNLSFDVDDKHN